MVSSFVGSLPKVNLNLVSTFIAFGLPVFGLLKSELEGILSDAEDVLQDGSLSDEEKVGQLEELILEGGEDGEEEELEEEV
jgi:hypothetical protein